MQAGGGDDEPAIATHIDAGAEDVAPRGHPDIARVEQKDMSTAAAGAGDGRMGQVSIQELQVVDGLSARFTGPFVDVDDDETGDGAGDDADAVGGEWSFKPRPDLFNRRRRPSGIASRRPLRACLLTSMRRRPGMSTI